MKKIYFAMMALFMALTASADVIEATLNHTAGTRFGSSATTANTLDAAEEYVNNDATSGWCGWAFAEFSFEIPEGQAVKSATFTYNSKTARGTRTNNVYVLNDGVTFDFDGYANQVAYQYAGQKTQVAAYSNVTTSWAKRTIDVTDNVKAAVSGVITFQVTNDAASGFMAGKADADRKPTLVIETIDASAVAKATVNWVCGESVLKSAERDATIGANVELETADVADFILDGVKYIYLDNNAASVVVAADGSSVVTVNVRKAEVYNYSVVGNDDVVLNASSGFEGETVNAPYPHYQLIDGTLYSAGPTNKEYRKSLLLDEDNKTVNITYSESAQNVEFYSEAENIEGLAVVTFGNVAVRASNALAAKATADTKIASFSAGKYVVKAGVFSSSSSPNSIVKIALGNTVFEAPVAVVNASEVSSAEITINKESDLVLLAEGMGDNNALDYIYVQKVGEADAAVVEAFAALKAAIDEANELSATLEEGDAKSKLDEEIDVAQGVYDNSEDAEELETATTALKKAIKAAQSATAIKSVSVAKTNVVKFIENGQVKIVKNGKTVSVSGIAE